MTLEEYKKKMNEEEDWAPGWLAIDEAFEKVYGKQEPKHFGTVLTARAILGGDDYLDGYSIYENPNGYKHLLTYGMSELYTNEEAFGQEWSKWAYEMTIKLKENTVEQCMWAINLLSNIARYTFKTSFFYEPNYFIVGNGAPINTEMQDSKISAVLFVPDTEIEGIDTLHGRVEFLQLVGITENEVNMLQESPNKTEKLVERLKEKYPHLETDMYRSEEYIF
jgi:Suppressor of fused protein (SUFU).